MREIEEAKEEKEAARIKEIEANKKDEEIKEEKSLIIEENESVLKLEKVSSTRKSVRSDAKSSTLKL